jgi:hypothetical protein
MLLMHRLSIAAAVAGIFCCPVLAQVAVQSFQLEHLQLGQLPPHCREYARTLGDRLLVKGKERVILAGTLSLPTAGVAAANVQVTLEPPNKIRIDNLTVASSVAFDGTTLAKNNGAVAQQDYATIDSFSTDFTDLFLFSQLTGGASRLVTQGARLMDGGKPVDPPVYCDVVHTTVSDTVRGMLRQTMKSYCFNSTTKLLERVSYTDPNSPQTQVQTVYSNWQLIQGQRVPGKVARYENGSQVMLFQLAGATVGPTAADTAFIRP